MWAESLHGREVEQGSVRRGGAPVVRRWAAPRGEGLPGPEGVAEAERQRKARGDAQAEPPWTIAPLLLGNGEQPWPGTGAPRANRPAHLAWLNTPQRRETGH